MVILVSIFTGVFAIVAWIISFCISIVIAYYLVLGIISLVAIAVAAIWATLKWAWWAIRRK